MRALTGANLPSDPRIDEKRVNQPPGSRAIGRTASAPDGEQRAPQRIGRPYCKPPLVHNALRPRAIFNGEPWPTLRSKLSP